MKREELRAQGLSDAQIEFVMQQNGQDIENARQNSEAAQAERARADSLQTQLDTVRADLQAAQTGAATAAELRRQLGEAQARLDANAKANAVRDALTQYNPKDAAVIMRLLDMDKITLTDGALTGLKEQMDPMKENSGFLFTDTPDPNGGNPNPGNGGGEFNMNAFLRGQA